MRTTRRLIARTFLILFTSICFGQTGPTGPQAVAKQDPNRVVATAGGKQITAQQAWGMISTVAPPARIQGWQAPEIGGTTVPAAPNRRRG